MAVMLERWNDDRMDALAAKVEGIEVQLEEHRRETKAGFDRVDERLDKMSERFDALYRAMIALSGAIVVGFATLATQL